MVEANAAHLALRLGRFTAPLLVLLRGGAVPRCDRSLRVSSSSGTRPLVLKLLFQEVTHDLQKKTGVCVCVCVSVCVCPFAIGGFAFVAVCDWLLCALRNLAPKMCTRGVHTQVSQLLTVVTQVQHALVYNAHPFFCVGKQLVETQLDLGQ